MSAADKAVDRGADKLAELSRKAERAGGLKAKLAGPLADDAEFLRKLKPTLIAARARGEAPRSDEPQASEPVPPPRRAKPKPQKKAGGGASPFLVIGAALALGVVLAHVVDWLGHRYPRD